MFNLSTIARLREVVIVLFDYELYHVLKVSGLHMHLPLHRRFERREVPFATQPDTLCRVFERLGGAFIKLGQLLALRPDLVGKEYSTAFERLLEDVPPEHPDAIRSLVKDIPFTHFSSTPLGSASIAQVHKATLKGKVVAVKIKRPGIDVLFESDIHIMEYIARKLDEHYKPEYVSLIDIVSEFKRYTEKELDFQHEARNIQQFRQNFQKNKSVVIPEVYPEYSTKDILIMEFIEGNTILAKKGKPQSIIPKVTNSVYEMLFDHRFFHADLHPGNILVHKNKVAFLDFGIVGHIDRQMERKLFMLFSGLVNADLDGVANALLDINIGEREPNVQYLRDGLYETLGEFYNQPLEKMHFGKIFYGCIDVARRSHIRMPANLVLFGKSLVTMDGFCREIDPKFNVVKNAKPYIAKHAKKQLNPKKIAQKAKQTAFQLHDLVSMLPEHTRSFSRKFTLIEKRIIDIDITFRKLTDHLWKLGVLISLAIIFATLLISSVILIHTPPLWNGYSVFSIVGGILCIPILMSILRTISHH